MNLFANQSKSNGWNTLVMVFAVWRYSYFGPQIVAITTHTHTFTEIIIIIRKSQLSDTDYDNEIMTLIWHCSPNWNSYKNR